MEMDGDRDGLEAGSLSSDGSTGVGGISDWGGKDWDIAVGMDGDVVWFSDNEDPAVRLSEDAFVEVAGSIRITTVALMNKF